MSSIKREICGYLIDLIQKLVTCTGGMLGADNCSSNFKYPDVFAVNFSDYIPEPISEGTDKLQTILHGIGLAGKFLSWFHVHI